MNMPGEDHRAMTIPFWALTLMTRSNQRDSGVLTSMAWWAREQTGIVIPLSPTQNQREMKNFRVKKVCMRSTDVEEAVVGIHLEMRVEGRIVESHCGVHHQRAAGHSSTGVQTAIAFGE